MFYFRPENWGRFPIWRAYEFPREWCNHQLDYYNFFWGGGFIRQVSFAIRFNGLTPSNLGPGKPFPRGNRFIGKNTNGKPRLYQLPRGWQAILGPHTPTTSGGPTGEGGIIAHKYPPYRAYIGISHDGVRWARGTCNYPLKSFGSWNGIPFWGDETMQMNQLDHANEAIFLCLWDETWCESMAIFWGFPLKN